MAKSSTLVPDDNRRFAVLKPAIAGNVLKDPQTGGNLAEKGEQKELTQYWLRQIASGEALVINSPSTAE